MEETFTTINPAQNAVMEGLHLHTCHSSPGDSTQTLPEPPLVPEGKLPSGLPAETTRHKTSHSGATSSLPEPGPDTGPQLCLLVVQESLRVGRRTHAPREHSLQRVHTRGAWPSTGRRLGRCSLPPQQTMERASESGPLADAPHWAILLSLDELLQDWMQPISERGAWN